MACIVILEVTAKKGTGLELLETFRTLLADTRNKDGCQSVEVATNLDNSDNLVLVEHWATRQHYENYLAWRQQRGDLDKLAGALGGTPSRVFGPAPVSGSGAAGTSNSTNVRPDEAEIHAISMACRTAVGSHR